MTVERVVVGNELLQIVEAQRFLFEGVVDVGAIVVKPDLFSPRFLTGGVVVEEQHIGLDAVGVEDAGGQAQDGVQFGGFQ